MASPISVPMHTFVLGILLSALGAQAALANQPPVASSDLATTREVQAVSVDVTDNDGDPDGDAIRLVYGNPVIVAAAHGTTARVSDSTIAYTPDAGFTGTDTFRYRITDGAAVDSAVVTITVVANTPPVAQNDVSSTREGQPADINVIANDSDPDGDAVRLVLGNPVIVAASFGTTTRVSDSTIAYTPNAGFTGTDTFRYRITDGSAVDSAVVTVTVAPNGAPMAVADRKATPLDVPVNIHVTANDSDPNGDPIRLVNAPIIELPAHGTATRLSDSVIRYTPSAGFSGTDTFRYRITDGFPGSVHSALVTVRVDNKPPNAIPETVEIHAGNAVTIAVTANDTDPDGDTVVLTASPILTLPSQGTASRVSNTSIDYTPNAGFVGTDSFRYRITDGWDAVDSALVTVNVTNSAPVARDDSATTNADTSVTIDVAANDSDPDGDTFIVAAITSQPSNGASTRLNDRDVRYTPDAGYTGDDSFTYQIRDAFGATATARVDISVQSALMPEVTSVERSPVPRGTSKVIVIHGANLQDADVHVATLPLEEGDVSTRVYPTAQPVSINGTGTRMEVRIDATDEGVDGFYNLAVETPGGVAAAQFRVAGPEPVIDMWTPSEPIAGRVHVLQVAGLNLAGADVVPMNPGVMILGLDNENDQALSGLLFISRDVPMGELDIEVQGTGGSIRLPMELRPDIPSASLPTNKVETAGAMPGAVTPEIYFQMPATPYPAATGRTGDHRHEDGESVGEGTPALRDLETDPRGCLSINLSARISYSSVLLSLFDDLGDPLTRQALNALVPGQRLDFSSLTLAISGYVESVFFFKVCDTGITDLSVCIRGGLTLLVPGIGGRSITYSRCFDFFREQDVPAGNSGGVSSNSYTTTNPCIEVFDRDPGFTGERFGEVQMNCCESATISNQTVVHTPGMSFVGDGPIFDVNPECAEPPPASALKVKEVSFEDDITGIRRDTQGSADEIVDPVWHDPDLDGTPAVADNAVAYVKGRKIRVRAILSTMEPPAEPIAIRVSAVDESKNVRLESEQAVTVRSSDTPVELVATQPLPDMTQAWKNLELKWSYMLDDGTTMDAGRTSHLFFVTLDSPLRDPGINLTVSALHLGIGTGGAADPIAGADRAWATFRGLGVTTWEGRELHYYREGFGFGVCDSDALGLLMSENRSGMCGAFAFLLRDALGALGIQSRIVEVRAVNDLLILVKNWRAAETSFPDFEPLIYKLELTPIGSGGPYSMLPRPPGDRYGDLVSLTGIPGQNAPTPSEKVFSNHALVQVTQPLLTGRYFDPSYGEEFSNERDFQDRAVWGVAGAHPADADGVFRAGQLDANSPLFIIFQ